MRRRDRRHGSSEGEQEASPLGDGWPPLSAHYVRVSEDLSVPPLVGGRPLVKDAHCPLCTLGEDLVAMGVAPENAAWAEHDLAAAICSDAPSEEAIESLRLSCGVEFTEAEYVEHRRRHTPSYRTNKLEALRDLADCEFDDASWRSIFDTLYLATEDLRRGLASGETRLSPSEGLAATKLLSELLSYSITDEGEEEKTPLILMQAFMADVVELVEVHVKDSGVRAALYADLQAASNEHIQSGFDAANSRHAPLLPRGRAEKGPE